MVSPMFSGGQDLHNTSSRDICNAILRPLFAYLCSNAEVDLSAGLEIKACVMSLRHTVEHDQKKRTLKRPPPSDHLVGHRGSSLALVMDL